MQQQKWLKTIKRFYQQFDIFGKKAERGGGEKVNFQVVKEGPLARWQIW